jgi:hypothetical protein
VLLLQSMSTMASLASDGAIIAVSTLMCPLQGSSSARSFGLENFVRYDPHLCLSTPGRRGPKGVRIINLNEVQAASHQVPVPGKQPWDVTGSGSLQ